MNPTTREQLITGLAMIIFFFICFGMSYGLWSFITWQPDLSQYRPGGRMVMAVTTVGLFYLGVKRSEK